MNEDNWKGPSSLVSTIALLLALHVLLALHGADYEFLLMPLSCLSENTAGSGCRVGRAPPGG